MQRSLERRLSDRRKRRQRRNLFIGGLLAVALMAVGIPKALQPVLFSASASPVHQYRAAHNASAKTGDLRLSEEGARFIASFEGFFPELYNDPVGHCTIGYGTLIHLGPCTQSDRDRWGTLTRSEALALLRRETDRIDASVHRLVRVKLNQAQHDMLVSFAYNCGLEAFKGSTLLRLLNSGMKRSAANQLLRWNRAGGQELAGLTRRRVAERQLFLGL